MDSSPQVQALQKKAIRELFRGNELLFAISVINILLLGLLAVVMTWSFQQIVDLATGLPGRFTLLEMLYFCIGLLLVMLILEFVDYTFRPIFIKRAMSQYKKFAFEQLSKKNIQSFNNENSSLYISALTNDANSIEANYLVKSFALAQMAIMFVGAIGLMLYYSPYLTVVALLLSILPLVGALLPANRLAKREKQVSDRNEGFVGMVKDLLGGFSMIKSFKAELEAIRLFNENNLALEESKLKRKRTEIIINAIANVAGMAAWFGVFLFGTFLAISGRGVTAGVVIVFVQSMNYVLEPIQNLPPILANRKAAYALINKLCSSIASNVRSEGVVLEKTSAVSICTKDLSFAYEVDKPVLNNLNLNFESGKCYALVGASGSGKTTLLNLLLGSYEQYEGQIEVNGIELRQISSDSLYDLLSIVQQNVFIFNNSILENVTLFRKFDEEQIRRALSLSQLQTLVDERGSEYLCGENGNKLSGGERQRISIARCLLHGTPGMLVDEATASLDNETALSVINAILDIPDLMRIIVTHRLEEKLLRKYDCIYVLKQGSLHETGTFEELMAQKGYFYSLYMVSQ